MEKEERFLDLTIEGALVKNETTRYTLLAIEFYLIEFSLGGKPITDSR